MMRRLISIRAARALAASLSRAVALVRAGAIVRAPSLAHAAARARAAAFASVAALALLAGSCATVPPPPPEPATPPAPREPEVAPPGEGVLPPTEPPRFEIRGEPMIDVGLAWDLDSLRIQPTGISGVSLQLPGDVPKPIPSGNFSAVIVRCSKGRGWAELAPDKRRWNLEPGDTLWLARDPSEHAHAARTRWNGKTWRGTLKVFLNPRGKLTLANRLPLETYLIGVVPGEIGALSDSLIEAGRAQAVAARSYTLFYRGRRAAEGFDLYGTVEDQMYAPVESERLLATRCVNGTAGVVALSDGWPIRANYCSTCGGITAEVWEAWPADPLDYLVSGRDREGRADYCAASSHYRWREEWKANELAANLAKYGPAFGVPMPPGGVGEILDVQVAARSRSGRVWRLEVRTTNGEITVPAHSLRQVLRRAGNANAILRSNLFKVDVRRDRASGRTLAIVATGAGSGHGVGLCQTGALGMARAGKRGEEILRRYYAGVVLKRLY